MAHIKDNKVNEATPSEDDSYSVIERLADAIRIEDDPRLTAEDRARVVQDLYEGPRKCQCCINWVDEVPLDAELDVLEKQDDTHPLILRRRVMPGEEKTQVLVHSIEVRHPGARAVLFDVFKGLDGIVPEVKYLVFRPPFQQFFWRWDRFEAAIEAEQDEFVKSVLLQLRAIVKRDLAEAFAVSEELTSHGVITHKYLWTLFAPGEIIYTNDGGPDQFYILYSSHERPHLGHPYEVSTQFVDWSGKEFGYNMHSFMLWKFKGTRKITELVAYPAKYLPNYDEVRDRCIERGKKFVELAGIQYKAYRSNAKQSRSNPGEDGSRSKAQQIDRRIIVDAAGHPNSPGIHPLVEPEDLMLSTGLITQAPVDAVPAGGHRPLQLQQNALVPAQVIPVAAPMPMMPPMPFHAPPATGMPRPPVKMRGKPGPGSAPRRRPSTDSLSSYYSDSGGMKGHYLTTYKAYSLTLTGATF